jgi:hypothetical protein
MREPEPCKNAMPRKRKSTVVSIGSTYYDPTTSQPSIDYNYRYLFLKAIERQTPEVLTRLRHRVWPQYDSLYWRVVPPISHTQWLFGIHPQLAWSWMSDKKPEGWTPRASRTLAALKRRLFEWSAKHQIHSDWMLMRALDTMFYWTHTESDPGRQGRERRFDREWKRRLKGQLEQEWDREWKQYFGSDPETGPGSDPEPETEDATRYSWDAFPRWFFPGDADQHFVYAGWRGEDPLEYIQDVLAQLGKHLRGYLVTVGRRAASLPKTPVLRNPERFEMLALYLCRNMTREQIKKAGFHKDLSVIFRDIQKAANLIGLTLRKPGKPRR